MGGILKDVPTDLDLRDAFTGDLFIIWLHLWIAIIKFSLVVFDKDRSGFASSSEIKAVMANLGVHFTDDEMQEMMLEVADDIFQLNTSFTRLMSTEITRLTSKSSKLWWRQNKMKAMNKILYFQKTLPSVHQQQMFAWDSHRIRLDFSHLTLCINNICDFYSLFCKTHCKIYVEINQQ